MDILRRELEEIYLSQSLCDEALSVSELDDACKQADNMMRIENGCVVVTDASSDCCYIYSGDFGVLMGYATSSPTVVTANSSDEDAVYERIHPEDLVDKRLLEYEFFKYVDGIDVAEKSHLIARCRIRMRDCDGQYRNVDNTTRIVRLSPKGKMWLILCTYTLSINDKEETGICPGIINTATGEVITYAFGSRRKKILSEREKAVLQLIRTGKPSKLIADMLGISINTVNRHRQNILRKLSVGNSIEAVTAATVMNLL